MSVGDENFKHKCKKRMDKLWGHNTTILVVSHSLDFIQQSCDRAIWINRGKIEYVGKADETIHQYLASV